MRTAVIIIRVDPKGKAVLCDLARSKGKTLSEFTRELWKAAVKAAQPRLPRDRWCTLCNMQPLTCDRIRPECERCNRLQEELGQ